MAVMKRKQRPQGARRKAQPEAVRTSVIRSVVDGFSRWLNRLLILAGLAVVGVLIAQAAMTLLAMPVEHITVTGKLEHTRTEAVQATVQPALAGGFLQADLMRLQRELESLPWIYSAQVRRRWPNALEIHVVEQLPIARWGEQGFLNHEGEIFHSEPSDAWRDLPRLSGPERSNEALVHDYQRLQEYLAPLNLTVTALASDDRGQLRAHLAGGIELVVGDADFKERLSRFIVLYQKTLKDRISDLARVDLRYQRGVAVEFREPEQIAGFDVTVGTQQ
ncbi:MAG: FtsQ-type POTRA domain-containing protein [Pseudomonadota bacterium]